jgi:GNAT superfamily N-acetyltransferase
MSFTINDECGLLVEGFDRPPVVLMTYNPPWYARHLEAAGFSRSQDLYAYRMDVPEAVPARLAGLEAALARRGIVVRPLDFGRFEEEVRRVHRVHSQAWAENWGAVPLTADEMHALAKELKPLADRDLVFLAEDRGEPIGVCITVPDVNQALAAARGRLLPFGLVRLLLAKRRIDAVRVLIMGVLRGYRHRGIDAAMYARTMAAARRKGYRWGEMSWVLESNPEMMRVAENLGAERYKTYRLYDLAL